MPPLPIPPAPRPVTEATRLPFAGGAACAQTVDVPRYFIEVNVPGYSVDRAIAQARRQRQQQRQQQEQRQSHSTPSPELSCDP